MKRERTEINFFKYAKTRKVDSETFLNELNNAETIKSLKQ